MSVSSQTAQALFNALAASPGCSAEIITILNQGGTTSVLGGIAALAGGAKSGATPVSARWNQVSTVATAGDSVLLPAAVAGVSCFVQNIATNACGIYAAGADVIQGIATTVPMLLAGGALIEFKCVVAGTWAIAFNAVLESAWSTNTTTTTFLAGQLTGGGFVSYLSTATTPGSIATRTATQMFNDTPNAFVGMTYVLMVGNLSGSANTLTITAGSGVTLTGTATVAQNIGRFYQVTFNSATTLTIQEMFAVTIAA